MREETLEDVLGERNCCGCYEGDCRACNDALLVLLRTWLLSKIPQGVNEQVLSKAIHPQTAWGMGYRQALADIKRNMGL